MARIHSDEYDPNAPRIDRASVVSFFEQRARKIGTLGPMRAVIYQDKHPDLAERRDRAEKDKILPLLALERARRLLDVGCGTGRWVTQVRESSVSYHGIDVSPGLVDFARDRFGEVEDCRFSVGSVDEFSLASLDEREGFDRILCAGVLIYLNDDEVARALHCFEAVAAPDCRILFREPMSMEGRLTIKEHFSDDMEQTYNAIYRSRDELADLLEKTLLNKGFSLISGGEVYPPDLNNRSETRQRWMLVERSA